MDTRDNNINNSVDNSNRTNPTAAPRPTGDSLRHESSSRSIQYNEYNEMDPRFESDTKSTRSGDIGTDRDSLRTPDSYRSEGTSTFTQIENKLERIYDQVESMLTSQLKLAKTEINEKIEQVESGAMSLTAGGVVTLFGAQVLVFACVLLLGLVMPLWGSALIVSGVLLAVGVALLAKGKKDLEPSNLTPDRSINQAKETARAVRREL